MDDRAPCHDVTIMHDREPEARTRTLDPIDASPPDDAADEAGSGVPFFVDDRPLTNRPDAPPWLNWVSWAVVGACCAVVLWSLHPQLLLSNSTPTGGDMGAHVWGPDHLARSLLPDLRLTGWTQDWYAGFPAYTFYMVVPSLAIVWLASGSAMWDGSVTSMILWSVVRLALLVGVAFGTRWLLGRVGRHWSRPLVWAGAVVAVGMLLPVPYNVAFKIVSVSGLVTLPIAAYLLARAFQLRFPGPALAAVATLPFIYDTGFSILGGNGASTMAGEFAFSISLSLALTYLAVMVRGSRNGSHRALGAVLLALTILCHLIPAIFVGIASAILSLVRREDREPWWDSSRAGRIVASVVVLVVGVTLLANIETLVGDDRFPGPVVAVVDLLGPVAWLFPAVASIAALLLFTGFEPRVLDHWRTPVGRRQLLGIGLVGLGVLVLALTVGLLDPSPWLWVLVAVLSVLTVTAGWDVRLVRWLFPVAAAGIAATGFWSLPFLGNSTYMNDMGWERYTRYTDYLLSDPVLDSGGMPYRNAVFLLAGLGVVLALVHRARFGYFLALTVMAFAWIFRYFPQYRLWNARLLPFYYLAIYLLAGLAVALVIRSLMAAVQEVRRRREESAVVGVAGLGVATVIMAVVVIGSFSMLPGGTNIADPGGSGRTVHRWQPLALSPVGWPFRDRWTVDLETTFVHEWARWNYSGVEAKEAHPEFAGIMEMMQQVGDEHGCGRAMWEYESDLQRFGTPMALMMLPYYTDGCIGSMEGLYFEASSTTPFHFLNQSELSTAPSRAQRDLPYSNQLDVEKGISHLQLMGVRYYMATTEAAIAGARADERASEVAAETFSWTREDGTVTTNTWVVFEIDDTDLVVPLEHTPAVLEDANDHIDGWVYAEEHPEAPEGEPRIPKEPGPAVEWYNDPTRWDVLLATSGPDDWPTAAADGSDAPREPLPEVEVTDVVVESDTISFSVSETGVPVLVKVSYFPNWTASGADGPFRATPNFMVVVPTDEQVTLSYARSPVEIAGWAASAAGVVGIVGLAMRDARPARREDEVSESDEMTDVDETTEVDGADEAARTDEISEADLR